MSFFSAPIFLLIDGGRGQRKNPRLSPPLQCALLRTQTEKENVETDLLKAQEKVTILDSQNQKSNKDRENLQAEMEMLLDRINKLSELLDKSRVG